MGRVCDITGKKTCFGNNVSHANNKTRRKFYPNLHEKSIYIPEKKIWVWMKLSTKALRTFNKNGVLSTLIKARKKNTLNKDLWPIASY